MTAGNQRHQVDCAELSCPSGNPVPALASRRSSTPWLRGAAFIWIALCVVFCVRALLFPATRTLYPTYANAGRYWLESADTYRLERDEAGALVKSTSGYRYSPLVSTLFVPFSLLPDGWGGALWRLCNYACFLAAFASFVRYVLPGSTSLGPTNHAALWLLLLPLSLASMSNGQANVLLTGLLLGAGVAVVRERWGVAAIYLAGACLLKLYPLAIALLMLVVYPRQLGWRFLLTLGVGLALPFALQHPHYVLEQYANWLELLKADDRWNFALSQGYRDFYLLTRFIGAPMHPTLYLACQLLAAAGVAGVCLLGRLNIWPKSHLVQTLLGLGCCWMVVFGPSTESCTFILLAPTLAWGLVDSFQPGRPTASRAALALVLGMFLTSFIAGWFPGGRDWFYVLEPMGALVLFANRLLLCRPPPLLTVISESGKRLQARDRLLKGLGYL